MYDVDLHTHTRFFHGLGIGPTAFDPIGVRLLTQFSRWYDLDGVALTNHDYHAEFDLRSNRPRVIPGIEITTTAGHVLVVGPDPPARTTPGTLTPEDAVERAHQSGCAAIIAHPFRRSQVHESEADFDAVELNGKHPERHDRVNTLASALELPVVGGSDAHFPFGAGRVHTRIDVTRLTPASIVAAIKAGRVEPRWRQSRLDRFMQRGYGFVHRYLR